MFFEEDDEEENKKVSFRDIVESVNGSINKNENRPSFSDLVEAINPSKKEKVDTSNRTVTVETPNTIDDEWKEAEDVYAKNIDVTQGVNKNSSLYDNKNNRVTQKNVLPTVSKTTETIKGEKTSKQINDEIKAIKKSNQINEDIEKGGVDAFNAIVENSLNAIPGGMKSAVAGLANVATTASALGVRGLEFISSITGNQETSDRLKEVYNNIIDTGSNIKSEGDHSQNINARIKNGVVRDIGNTIHTISNVATNQAIGAAFGMPGTITQGLSVGGHSAQEVLDENKDSIGKATLTGIAKGYTSYLIERMFDANILTKGQGSSISNKIDDIIYDSIKNKFGREVANFGAGILGENIEEIVEGNIDNFIDYLINDKELPTIQEWWEETKETVKLTTLSTIIMNFLGMGGGRFANKEADILQRKAQEFIDKGGANLQYDINSKVTNTGTVFTTTFENGQITQVQAVEGKEIINPNKKVNIIPAIIRNSETNAYNVIDKNTGVVIDSTPYNSLLSAQAEFNKKMINLNQEQINSINSEVEKLDLTIKNKISEVVEQTKAQINANNYQNSQNASENNQIQELDNKTTNDMSQDFKSLKNEPGVSNFVTNEKKTRIDNPEVANSIFDSKKSYKLDEIENIYQNLEEIITTNNLENYISIDKTKNNTIEIGEYIDDISSTTTINSIELKPDENGMITGQQINDAIQELAKIENENQPIKGQLDIEGNQVYSEKKGVNKNVRNENTRQKINRTEERKNSRGEEKTSRSNGTNQKELSRGLQKFQKEQRKINKDFTATLADNITETEKIIQNAFSNLTGINYGIFTTNKGTSQGAFFVDNNIFVKHNSFNNKKASNFYPFHEFGHYLKVNKNAEWKAIYNIIDRTITKEQIEKYKDVIKDKAIFKNKSEQEVREYIIEEIESDYIGNWANDIINWKPFIEARKLSNEYIELLIDITNENITTHYNIFGTQEQQEQVYTKITEVMNKVLNKNNVETKENEIKYSDREDVDIIDKYEDVWYDENGIEIDSGKLVEAINTDTPNLKKGRNYKEFGDYFYIFDKIKFNKYKVFGTIRIEGNEDLINSIRGGKRNGIKQKSKDIIGLLKESRYGRRTNNNNNDSSKETRSNRENVGLYNKNSRQSRENKQGQIGRRSNENRNTNLENSNNKSSFIMQEKDNQGRTLTKEQQEHFKDSKVRDENGNLLVVYHVTDTDFTIFDSNKFGKNTHGLLGIYLSTEPIKIYGDRVIKCYADIKNPVTKNSIKITEQQFKQLLHGHATDSDIEYAWRYLKNADDLSILTNILNRYRANKNYINPDEFYNNVKEITGYDGAIIDNYANGRISYVAFNSSQIKNVDNTNPTDNPDIRYSDRTDIVTDNQGRTFTKEQQEHYKDVSPELKDENGNLLVMYHGTDNKFNIFDKKEISKKTKNAGFYGDGFYFTTSKERADVYRRTKDGEIKEVYLKMKNPFIFSDIQALSEYEFINNLVDLNPEWANIYTNWKEQYTWGDIKNDYQELKQQNLSDSKIDNKLFEKYGEIGGDTWNGNDLMSKLYRNSKKHGFKTFSEALKEKGYDGVISDRNKNDMTEYVVFNSNQIKNVDNTNPTSNPDIRYSDRIDIDENGQGGFYSQLENVIEQKMPNSSNSQQILNLLKNNGIKQDEIDWIGIEDYINSKKLQKISKQEVLDYIRANQINIETIEKGDSKLRELKEPIEQDIASKNVEIQNLLDKYGIDYEEDDLVPYKRNGLRAGTIGDFMAENLEKLIDLNDFEKYEKQEDGSFIHRYKYDDFPFTYGFTEEDLKRDMQELAYLYDERQQAEFELLSIEDEYGDYADELGVPKYKDYKLQGGNSYREILFTVPSETNIQVDNENYNSPHWQEKNVIAHARTQDFEDANGNKVLFIDEIQSDMHQEGRKEGYRTREQDQRIKSIENKMEELRNKTKDLDDRYYEVYKEVRTRMIDKMNETQNAVVNKEKFDYVEKILTHEDQKEYSNFITDIVYNIESVYDHERIDALDRKALETKIKALIEEPMSYALPPTISDTIINKFKDRDEFYKYTFDFAQSGLINDIKEDYKVGVYSLRESDIKKYATTKETDIIKERNEGRANFNKQIDKYNQELNELKYGKNVGKISDLFPFKKNWHEFVLRRMINNAVLQGYDKVAWTTGRQQRERYNLAKVIDSIEYYKPENLSEEAISISAYKGKSNVLTRTVMANELSDYIGKDLANRIINSKDNIGVISNLDETINENPNSGMYLFYDQEIPNYLNKYLKKWNSKVEEIILENADRKEQSKQMGFTITEEMKKSVKEQGQPLYSNRNLTEETTPYDERVQAKNKEFIAEYKKKMYTEDLMNIPNDQGLTNAQGANRLIEQEIQKIEKTGKWDNSIPVTKLTDIRKTIEDYLGLGIKRGKFRQRAYGIYKQGRDVIRVKEYKDMDNVLHETGHALDLGNRLKIDKETIADELLAATAAHGGYENETKQIQLDEGFAEVIREYAIIPEEARIHYPQTVAVIEQIRVNDKEFDAFISKLQKQIYNYIHQNPSNRVLSNISIGEQTDKRQLSKAWIKQEVMRNVYDKDYALKSAVNELAKAGGKTVNEIRASQNAYYLTRLASGIDSKITSMLSNGYIDESGNQIMPGLNQIGDILGNNPARFNDLRAFLVAQRDLEYKAKSLKTGIRTLDSKAVVERFKNDSQIQRAAKVVYQTLDGVLQYAQNNKLISEEEANALRKSNAFYVPMQRVIENNSNNVGKRGAVADIIKKRTGSELDVKDVLENIIANSANVIQQVENNSILKALYTEGEKSKLTGAIYDVIPAPMVKIGTAKLQTWQKELEDQGIDISKIDFDKTIDLFSPNNKIDTRNLITSFINDQGKRIYLQFNDELIFNSLMNLDKQMMSQVLKINNKLNMPLRYGATMANVGFAIPNMISDTAQAAIYSNAGFIPIVDNAIGIIEILGATNKTARNFLDKLMPGYAERINNLYTMYQQSGASSATRLSQYRKSAQEIMKEVYGTSSKNLGIEEKYKPLKVLLDIMTFIPELSEQSTRLRVFERNYEAYKNKGNSEVDARILAALESRDATQDFGRTGNLTREINQVIPFSAARVGSAYTFAEKVKANPKQTGMRIAILTVIAMAIKAIGYDDEEIEELNQRKKDDNFVIKVGNTVMTIKKPQGILRSIINLAEYIQDLFTGNIEDGKEGERLGEWINNAIMDNMPADSITGLVPNMVAPLIENAINKDFYYNTEIVKSYDLDLPDSEQYYDYTSQLAILLGKIFNYSPAKIDNLINGYFAGLGTSVTNVLDWVAGKVGISAEEPNMGAEDNAVGKRFVVNVNENSASIDEIYDLKTELTKKKNGETITEEETEKLETITEAISNISKINKQIKEIKRDLTMSANEKAKQIRKLQQEKTDTARQALGKELIYDENEEKIESTQFYTTSETLKKNGYRLDMNSEMKKEYEELAYNYYKKYEKHGLYSKEKLETLKSKSKEYAKNELFKKYKSKIYKEEK